MQIYELFCNLAKDVLFFIAKNIMDSLQSLFRSLKPTGKEKLIGITGGIGTGKSAVADILRAVGCAVLSSDIIAKDLLHNTPELRMAIAQELGLQLDANGFLPKALLTEKVFGTTPAHHEAREIVNNLIHPLVIEEIARQTEELYRSGITMVFNESALLFETGFAECYDYIITVTATDETRLARLQHRGLSEQEFQQRKASQLSTEEKNRLADFVLNNDGTLEELRKATLSLLELLKILEPLADEDEESEE